MNDAPAHFPSLVLNLRIVNHREAGQAGNNHFYLGERTFSCGADAVIIPAMETGFRFRCYPTPSQQQMLLQWIGCQRFIYNAKVSEDRYFRTFARQSLNLTGQFAPIDQQYSQFKSELTPWLAEVPSQVLRNGAVRWMQAYSHFFQKLAGRPTIKMREIHVILSGDYKSKDKNTTMRLNNKEGVVCAEPSLEADGNIDLVKRNQSAPNNSVTR